MCVERFQLEDDRDVVEQCLAHAVYGARYRNLRISATPAGFRVTAPKRTPASELVRFLENNRSRIETWRTQMQKQQSASLKADYRDAGSIFYLGRKIVLRCLPGSGEARISDVTGEFLLDLPPSADTMFIRERVRRWLKNRFSDLYCMRSPAILARTGLSPKSVKASEAVSRWGMCTAAGGLELSWRLVCLKPEIFDYVLVHELAHLVHFDHSPAFWALVAQYCPNYKEIRRITRTFNIRDIA